MLVWHGLAFFEAASKHLLFPFRLLDWFRIVPSFQLGRSIARQWVTLDEEYKVIHLATNIPIEPTARFFSIRVLVSLPFWTRYEEEVRDGWDHLVWDGFPISLRTDHTFPLVLCFRECLNARPHIFMAKMSFLVRLLHNIGGVDASKAASC